MRCCALHNILLDCDGHDNWEEAMLEDDECMNVQHEILETIGRLNSRTGSSNQQGGFTRSQHRNKNEKNVF